MFFNTLGHDHAIFQAPYVAPTRSVVTLLSKQPGDILKARKV